jgi:hypothetical protein
LKLGKKAGAVVAVGLAAAATGIVVVAAIARWHERHDQDRSLATRLRDIQDVLSDCDSKLREIEQHLVPDTPAQLQEPATTTKRRRTPTGV